MTHLTDCEGTRVEKADVKQALADALRSPGFASSPQLSDFLQYIVEETVAGRSDDIKAYSIAIDALGKDEDFDPQDNAAVRVAAGRLRQTLALHNAESNTSNSALTITLEAGSYVPIFVSTKEEDARVGAALEGDPAKPAGDSRNMAPSRAATVQTALSSDGDPNTTIGQPSPSDQIRKRHSGFHFPTLAAAIFAALLVSLTTASVLLWNNTPRDVEVAGSPFIAPPNNADRQLRPGIAAVFILPDKTYPVWFAHEEVADSLAVTLARFDSYEFYGITTTRQYSPSRNDDADFTLLASGYNRNGNVRIFVQLIRGSDGVVLWSTQRLFTKEDADRKADVTVIIGDIIAPLMSPYGVIYSDLLSNKQQRSDMNCFITAYQYFYHESDRLHAEARECGENLSEKGSRLPSLYAALTFIYLDEYREDRNRRARDPLNAAEKMAAKAVQLGPLSARAHQAAFAVQKVQGHTELARNSGRRAVELNPYDTDIMSDYAAWLISVGDAQQGKPLLDKAVSLLQSRPAWVDFYRFLSFELTGDLKGAADISAMLDMKRSPLLAAAVVIGGHRHGNASDVLNAIEEIRRVEPAMLKDPKNAFIRRGFDDSVAQYLAGKLTEARSMAIPIHAN